MVRQLSETRGYMSPTRAGSCKNNSWNMINIFAVTEIKNNFSASLSQLLSAILNSIQNYVKTSTHAHGIENRDIKKWTPLSDSLLSSTSSDCSFIWSKKHIWHRSSKGCTHHFFELMQIKLQWCYGGLISRKITQGAQYF